MPWFLSCLGVVTCWLYMLCHLVCVFRLFGFFFSLGFFANRVFVFLVSIDPRSEPKHPNPKVTPMLRLAQTPPCPQMKPWSGLDHP